MNLGETTKSFAKYPMPTMLAVLCIAVCYLALENKALSKANTEIERSAKMEIAAIERRCSDEKEVIRKQIDEGRKEQIATMSGFVKSQKQMEDQIRSLLRKK